LHIRFTTALAVLIALVLVGGAQRAAADTLRYGVADDWPEWHPCGDAWWQAAQDLGFKELRLTVQWDATAPTTIPFQPGLAAAVDCARLADVRPILAIYPAKPTAIGSDPTAQKAFADFVALVGQTFPGVEDFVVGNEPNANRFWQPQYVDGVDAAATDYEHTLALSYDALKLVRPDAKVWGPAVSSRGNDSPRAISNPSHSPVWFIKEMGDAYRASGRTTPLFDVFDMHPYPAVQDRDPFSRPLQWPQAGAANLDRIKQAIWDAFHGTGQPVVSRSGQPRADATTPVGGLRIALDEAGEQTDVVDTAHVAAYDGTPENVVTLTEAQQAANYDELAELAACDPSVASLLYFPLIDNTNVSTGFQSGELYADGVHKASYDAVKSKLASAQGLCQGGVAGVSDAWSPARGVIGAQGIFDGLRAVRRVAAALTVGEDATFTATLQRLAGPSGPVARRAATVAGRARAYRTPSIRFPRAALRPGFYNVKVVLTAAVNPLRRSTLTSRVFRIGPSGMITAPTGAPEPRWRGRT
jgi:hypothetical protein